MSFIYKLQMQQIYKGFKCPLQLLQVASCPKTKFGLCKAGLHMLYYFSFRARVSLDKYHTETSVTRASVHMTNFEL